MRQVFVCHPDFPDDQPALVLVRSDGHVKIPGHTDPSVARKWKPIGAFSPYVQKAIKEEEMRVPILSYRARVYAEPGSLLLGGATVATSSRFADRSDAEAWMEACIQGNALAGRRIGRSVIAPSCKAAEIPKLTR